MRSTLPFCGDVRARHAKRDTICEEESAGCRVIKLTTIVTQHNFDGTTKLGAHIGKEIREWEKYQISIGEEKSIENERNHR
jgi:hypothetical protein